jgi:hypothetical protein
MGPLPVTWAMPTVPPPSERQMTDEDWARYCGCGFVDTRGRVDVEAFKRAVGR